MDHGDNYKGSNSLKHFSMNHFFPLSPMLIGPLLSGICIYFVLSSLLVPLRITVPISIIISSIIFGLTTYYSTERVESDESANRKSGVYSNKSSLSSIVFVIIYIFLVIFISLSKPEHQFQDIFIPWDKFSGTQLLSLGSAIALSFFVPGYALVSTLDRKDELKILPKFLLTYIFSALLTGLVSFITALMGFPVSDISIVLNIVYIIILIIFIKVKMFDSNFLKLLCRPNVGTSWALFKDNGSALLILLSLFALVILSTYYLYNGTLIGDQWFYHGKSLLFSSGAFKYFAVYNIDLPYPPFLPALLSGFFTLSGVPSVNAYISINFLNIMPILAFYYFFSKWVPRNRRKASMLACTLFTLSSGFGWIYVLSLANTHPITSPDSALKIFNIGGAKTFDIWLPNTFVDVGHPDITTGLTILGLPAGFVLLGLVKAQINGRYKYLAIVASVSTLGYLSHDEFGLFMIIASILPLIYRLSGKGTVFVAILAALLVAIMADIFFPGKYYIIRGIFGVPFTALYFLFVSTTWALYYSVPVLRRTQHRPIVVWQIMYGINDQIRTSISQSKILKIIFRSRIRFVFGIVLVSIVAYAYVLSFIILDLQISDFDVRFNTREFNIVPWHFYPLRFGVTGLVALSFILSYIFKKFEREVFVFGIIAIVAFAAGPYYNEFRFNKYIMVSMAGFASLLLYKILSIPKSLNLKRGLISSAFMGLVITSSSLSILMYVGYSAIGLENPSSLEFNTSVPRRHFPPESEIHMLNFLHSNINLKTDNVVIPSSIETTSVPYFYFLENQGLVSKLEGFLGIPLTRLAQIPSALNASTVQGFYGVLDRGGSRYIVLPKSYINDGLSEIGRFALENFPMVYHDDHFVILSVPPLAPATDEGEVALLLQDAKQKKIPSLTYSRILEYNNKSFILDSENNNSSYSNTEKIETLNGTTTLWSKPIQKEQNIDYVEIRFRIVTENYTDTHSGIVWKDGEKLYYAFLRSDKLSVYTPINGEFLSAKIDYPRKNGIWYTLKIIYARNSIDVYLDDALTIQIPKNSSDVDSISQIGIRSFNMVTEFEPLKIGQTSRFDAESTKFDVNSNYYYPINTLALSKTGYDTFEDNDFSAFSKDTLILTFDPLDTHAYLEFLRSGGTIVILNTDDNFRGGFSNLLNILPGKQAQFDNIRERLGGQNIKVSGLTRNFEQNSSDSLVKSFYLQNDQKVAPFAIEKKYENGRIIFVNSGGYFNSIAKSPDKFFLTLADVPRLIDLNAKKFVHADVSNSIPSTRFLGGLNMSGQVLINSSSFSLPKGYNLQAQSISLLNQNDGHFNKWPQINNAPQLNNTLISDLKLYGSFKVQINSTGLIYLPSLSNFDYIAASLPKGFDVTVNLFNGSTAELFLGKENQKQPIKVTHGNIYFHVLKSESDDVNWIPIVIKRPEINLNGKANFQKLHSANPNNPTKSWAGGVPIEFEGNMIAKFEHVDNYQNDTLPSITYLKWIKVNGNLGDTFEDPRKKILEPSLERAQNLEIHTKILVAISVLAIVSIYVWWPKSRKGSTKRPQT